MSTIGAFAPRRIATFPTGVVLPLVFAAITALTAVATPGFLSFDNIRAVAINASITGIVAVGMTAMTLSGNLFSLASGQSTMLASIIFTAVAASGRSPWTGAALALLALLVVGLMQAVIVSEGLNPIVTTLAAGTIIVGSVSWVTHGSVVAAPQSGIDRIATTSLFGLPLAVYAFGIVTLIAWFLLERTTAGRRIVLVGANRETAVISGISARAAILWVFAAMAVTTTIAGILSAAQLGQVTANDLSTLNVDAVAAVLVGGTAVQGGEGSPLRTATGALIIAILQNAMLLHGFSTGARLLGVGSLVLIVVAVLQIARRRDAS